MGKKPLISVFFGLVLYSAALVTWYTLLMPGLSDPVLAVGVPVYICWLTTTVGPVNSGILLILFY